MNNSTESKCCEKCKCDGFTMWKGNAREMTANHGCTCDCHSPIREESWAEEDIESLFSRLEGHFSEMQRTRTGWYVYARSRGKGLGRPRANGATPKEALYNLCVLLEIIHNKK